MKITIFISAASVFIFSLLIASPEARAESQDRPLPSDIDPSRYYVFYMHGTSVEKHGPSSEYKYYDILDALEAKGLVTIGEVRTGAEITAPNIMVYAKKVAGQVRRLIKAGVPPGHITVAGHSRGAHMTMRVAAVLKIPQVRYVPIAGCGYKEGHTSKKNYDKFTKKLAPKTRGVFLYMWEESDPYAGKCDVAMKRARKATSEELMLTVGGGHDLFKKPQDSWIEPFVAFVKGG